MAERFNLTAQIQLQAPTNTAQVVGQIRKQLQGASVDIKVNANPREAAAVNKALQDVNKSAASSAKSVGSLNTNLATAARRFSAITVATGVFLTLARTIKNSVGEAVAFEREMLKISQVTGKSVRELSGLSDEVTKLSRSLGTSSKDLLHVSRTLAQAGFAAKKTKAALEILAQTTLAATFTNIEDTTEAAIAVLRQFSSEAKAAGGDIKFLESTMNAINSVSKSFAVEAGDLTTVIRRVGGVFAAAGGEVNELIAIFTSVRSTTRESAETIATGLRTIFTRIQRTETVDQLKELGIELRNSEGMFVGAYEATKRLSAGLSALDPRDFRFSEIVEQLGGFRQIGKVIPMIQQFSVAQRALNVAQNASGSVAKDAELAQKGLGNQIAKVREDFEALMRQFADSSTFRAVAGGALELAKAFIKIASSLEGMLPLITTLVSMKIGQALAPGLGSLIGLGGGRRKNQGGRIHAFARGGHVPGTGNRDTVPAMLQPGEFVIKQSSAKKLGSSTLEAMNNNRYAGGGITVSPKNPENYGIFTLKPPGGTIAGGSGQAVTSSTGREAILKDIKKGGSLTRYLNKEITEKDVKGKESLTTPSGLPSADSGFKTFIRKRFGNKGSSEFRKMGETAEGQKEQTKLQGEFTKEQVGTRVKQEKGKRKGLKDDGIGAIKMRGPFPSLPIGGPGSAGEVDSALSTQFETTARRMLGSAVEEIANTQLIQDLQIDPVNVDETKLFDFSRFYKGAQEATEGFLLEGVVGGLTNATIEGGSGKFDFPKFTGKAKERLKKLFAGGASGDAAIDALLKADAKRQKETAIGGEGSLVNKISTDPDANFRLLASGGAVDSVPALLTPGEFVVNKSSAQNIGYNNLNMMNKTGVKRFAAGGAVGVVQRFAGGGPTGAGLGLGNVGGAGFAGIIGDMADVEAAFQKIGVSGGKLTAAMASVESSFEAGITPAESFDKAFKEMKDGIDEVKQAAEAAAEAESNVLQAEAKKAGAGDIVVEDVKKYGGDIGTGDVSVGGTVKAAKKDNAVRQQLIAIQKQEVAAIQRKIKATESGVSSIHAFQRAQDVVRDKYGGLAKEIEKSKSSFQKLRAKAGSLGGAAKRGLGKVGRGAQGMKGAAESAQSMAFFGTAIAATTIQMSGLSETTKQAATETVAFGAALVAGGATAIQMLAGLADIGKVAAATNVLEAGASGASTTADVGETGGSVAATGADLLEAGASMAVAAPLLILVGVVLAVVLALKYFSSKAKAEADALEKSSKANLDKIGSGEGGSAGAAKEDTRNALIKRDQETALSPTSAIANSLDAWNLSGLGSEKSVAVSVDDQGKASANLLDTLAQNASMYDILSMGLVNVTKSLFMWATTTDEAAQAIYEEQQARISMIAGIYTSIDSFARLAESGNKFDTNMKRLDKMNLPDTKEGREERIEREMAITADLDTSGVSAEFDKLSAIAIQTGVSMDQLSVESLTAEFGEGSAELIAFQTATRAGAAGMENLAKKTAAAASTLQKAIDKDLTGELSIDELNKELKTGSSQMAKAFRASQQSIIKEAKGKQAKAQAGITAAKERIASAGSLTGIRGQQTPESHAASVEGSAALEEATKDYVNATKEGRQAIKDQNRDIVVQNNARKAANAAELRAAAAAQNLAEQLQKTTDFMKQLSDIEFQQGQYAKGLSNQEAVLSGGDMDFSRDIQGLGVSPAMISDIDKFEKDMTNAIGDLPAGMQTEAKKQLKTVTQTSKVFNEGKKKVTTQFSQGKLKKDDLGKDVFDPNAILEAAMGPGAADQMKASGQGDLLDEIMENIKNAAKGGITSAEFDEIFAPMREAGEASSKALGQVNNIFNQEIDNYKKYVNAIGQVRDRDIASAAANIKAEQRVAEMMTKARGGVSGKVAKMDESALLGTSKQKGLADLEKKEQRIRGDKDLSSSQKREQLKRVKAERVSFRSQDRERSKNLKLRQRGKRSGGVADEPALQRERMRLSEETRLDDREQARTTSAQAGLAGIQAAGGGQLQAGNIKQILSTRMAAEKEKSGIGRQLETGVDATGKKLDDDATAKLVARNEKLGDVIKRTTDELGRLGDQSDRAADIMGEIEKEGAKRATAEGMLQDFVFGGEESRGAMNMGLAGVQSAAATGTVQNQSEEQRTATLGMLDKLGDIEVGGRKASDIKKQVIYDDAISMGLDPKIANAIATATTKEEKLIKSLDDLGDTIIHATKAQGTRFTPDFQPPGGLAATTTGVGTVSEQMAQSKVGSMSDQEVLETQHQQKLAKFDEREQRQKSLNAANRKKGMGSSSGRREAMDKIRQERSGYMKEAKGQRARFMQGTLIGNISQEEEVSGARERLTGQMTGRDVGGDSKWDRAIRGIQSRQEGGSVGWAPRSSRNGITTQGGAGVAGAGEPGVMLDTTQFQGVLAEFNTNFGTTLATVVTPFTEMASNLSGLNDSFQNLTMTHKFQGDLSMAFNITNQEELTTAIANTITPKVTALIADKVNIQIEKLKSGTAS